MSPSSQQCAVDDILSSGAEHLSITRSDPLYVKHCTVGFNARRIMERKWKKWKAVKWS